MGCLWSSEPREHCWHCNRRAVNNLIIVDHVCQICKDREYRLNEKPTQSRPLFGQYQCTCGRSWSSRLCWPNTYQICNYCKRNVYPHKQRELRPSDITESKNNQEHKKDLCQMCQQLGYYCGIYAKQNMK